MKTKSLSKSNPYLSQKGLSDLRIITSVSSSTAIETGEQIKTIEENITRHRLAKHSAVILTRTIPSSIV